MKNITTFLILYFITFLSYSQFTGSAYHKNFTFKEYLAQPQNWSIIQDARGIMYFANTGGILEYDGTNWRHIYVERNCAVLSLAKDSKGRIYVGGQGTFGYLKTDKIGDLKYVSLSSKIDTSKLNFFPNVWTMIVKNDEIYFRTKKGVFQFKPYKDKNSIFDDSKKNVNQMKIFNPNGKITGFYATKKNLFIRSIDGLYKKVNNNFEKIPHSEYFAKKPIYDIIDYESNKLLVGLRKKIVIFNPSSKDTTKIITDFKTEADEFFEKNIIYTFEKISYNRFIVGTRKGGAVIFDNKGKILDFFDTNNLLLDNSVWDFFHKNKVSWMALNLGISKIETDSPFRFLKKNNNIEGPIMNIIEYDSILYISNYNDIYYLELNKIQNKTKDVKFKKIKDNLRGAWDFEIFSPDDKKENEIFLMAKPDGFFSLEKNKLKKIIGEISCRVISKSIINKNKIFIGSTNKLSAMYYENNKWKEEKIKNINGDIISIEEEKNGNIWVTTYYNGVFYLKNNNKNSKIIEEQYELFRYDKSHNLPSLRLNEVYRINNEIYFATRRGFYKFDNKKEKFFSTNKFGDYKKPIARVFEMKNGDIWADGNKIFKKKKNGSYFIDYLFSKRLPKMLMTSMYEMNKNIFFFGAVDGLYFYDKRKDLRKFPVYNALIRKVVCGKDSVLFMGTNYVIKNDSVLSPVLKQNENLIPILSYENNTLNFNYSAPFFEGEEELKYSYKLDGFDKRWSEWKKETKKEYTNLYEGKYIFKVRAKNIYDEISIFAKYKFEILPPLHRTNFAYFIYLILSVIFIFFILKFYTKRLKVQNKNLEKIVKKRTKEIRERNEELKIQKKEILSKNTELEQQKEEILTQAEELLAVNSELEKLSLVASKTDNAVIIFDKNYNLEWINKGFSKIYGYSNEEFISKKINIIKDSHNSEIENLLEECIKKRNSVFYRTINYTKKGKEIWIHTTLTPIFNEKGNLIKLIAVETDITDIKKAHNKISLQNKKIESSLSYARTIQKSVLPIEQEMKKYFDFFIFFLPKDVVSGDFYWLTELKILSKTFVFVAVVDCVKNGPFMSVIGSRLLNEIIREKKVIDTAEILELLDLGIKKFLRQEKTQNKDNMNLCLCRFEKIKNKKTKVNFSGAKRPLFFFDFNKNIVEILKPDRYSVGGAKRNKKLDFSVQEVILQNNDIIYLTTDGYIDQNNMERQRFGTRQFSMLLERISKNSLEKQKQIMEKELSKWQENEKQGDDIIIMGIKNFIL